MIWLFRFNTESGDEGIGPYWTYKPTDEEVQSHIQSNSWLRDEQSQDCLHFSVIPVEPKVGK